MNPKVDQIRALADGIRPSTEIGRLLGIDPRYCRKIMQRYDMPRRKVGAGPDKLNHQYKTGRRVGLDGYVDVTAPVGHRYAKKRTNRNTLLIAEHRLVMEKTLGRYLKPEEVVDHVNGIRLHNDPTNLRVFASNGEHLAATITGKSHDWSRKGHQNIGARTDRGRVIAPVHIYRLRKERGDVRLLHILRAALLLGIDDPYLLGTHHHFEKAQIDPSSRTNLLLALEQLESRYAADRLL